MVRRLLSMALMVCGALPALALINVRYTPVDLVKGAGAILSVELGPRDGARMPVRVVDMVKGTAPAGLAMALPEDDPTVATAFADGATTRGLVFLGDFAEAIEADEGADKPRGALHVGTSWFGLQGGDNAPLAIIPDPYDLMTVWAGGNEMLERAAREIVAYPLADVPAVTGTTWSGDTDAGQVGPVTRARVRDVFGDGRPCLVLDTATGPRVFRFTADRTAAEVTVELPEAARARLVGDEPLDLLADLDGDGLPDRVQARRDGLFIARGTGPAAWAPPTLAVAAEQPGLPTALDVADIEGDGRLDVLLATAEGLTLLRNLGQGTFASVLRESGEVAYDFKPGIVGGGFFDVNGDNRQDLFLLYGGMAPQFYFNRGFACFGLSGDLAMKEWGIKANGNYQNNEAVFHCGEELMRGQQAGAVGDLDGDGMIDAALVTKAGRLWILWGNPDDAASLGLTVTAPANQTGPVTVVAHEGQRCLGARRLAPGGTAYFAKDNKGPLTLTWHTPDGMAHTRTVLVMKQVRQALTVG